MALSLEIFFIFFRLGLISFGGVFGVLPELERQIVIERNWVSSHQFVQAYVMGQFVPGPNMAMCAILGFWVNGVAGALAAFAGIYSGPFLVIGAAYMLYKRWRANEAVQRAEKAVRPVILGLLLASLFRLWWIQASPEGMIGSALSLLLIAFAIFAFSRKWLGSLSLLFVSGALWFGLQFLY
jgi:chromate transporter